MNGTLIGQRFYQVLKMLSAGAFASVLFTQPAVAQLPDQQFFTGQELLAASTVTFPDGAPTAIGSAIVLGPANTPRGVLIEAQYPPGGNSIDLGRPQLYVSWELTRLSCDSAAGCNNAGGPEGVDHDPIFFVSQGNKAYGWQIADNFNGSYYADSFEINNGVASPLANRSTRLENSGYFPAINQSYKIDISFILLDDGVRSTMNVVLPGRPDLRSFPFTFTHWGGFDPTKSFKVGIINEDNRGERYMLNRAGISPIPEPSIAITSLLGMVVIGSLVAARRNAIPPRLSPRHCPCVAA